MGRVLTDAAVEQYRDQGYYFPVPTLGEEEVSGLRAISDARVARRG